MLIFNNDIYNFFSVFMVMLSVRRCLFYIYGILEVSKFSTVRERERESLVNRTFRFVSNMTKEVEG